MPGVDLLDEILRQLEIFHRGDRLDVDMVGLQGIDQRQVAGPLPGFDNGFIVAINITVLAGDDLTLGPYSGGQHRNNQHHGKKAHMSLLDVGIYAGLMP